MKIIVTTSNKYLHLIPIFSYLFNKYWGGSVELVGYDAPDNLPENFTFHSLGEQIGGPENFTRDLRGYFAQQDQWFIWMMEDTFLKSVNAQGIELASRLLTPQVGRFNLTDECVKQDHYLYSYIDGIPVYANTPSSLYRLSTQVSIWNRDYLLQYMQSDLSPWGFECQSDDQKDGWMVLGFDKQHAPVQRNEGVRKRDLYKFDLNGLPEEDVEYINSLNIKV